MGYGAGIAPYAAVYSAVEDYTDGHLTNPSVPEDLRQARVGPVVIGAHAALGSSSVVLAAVTLGFGCAVGALTLVSRNVRPFEVIHGNPGRRVQIRDRTRLVALDEALRARASSERIELVDPTDWRAT